ncbi:GNAT family N-acetyltransferase [Flagellimonas allohymeniacidonis]|uniref:N-acetyltransferase domain-containing protein n=1 Tax=Flagellimonas allohymeniacidonis TaxID=2517819 RepID=A0A4Q8QET0_9FLAO|nr:GNAT family N-acetyltransferase [Allomuricauda hymeniacidonis]TAI48961.1 hypothetical protein EW142_03965 [Allomuricauda hymeniacidonis]
MKTDEKARFYKLRLFFIRIRHGLFLWTLRSILAKLGIDIGPYYWVLEGDGLCDDPKIKGNSEDYHTDLLSTEEIASLRNITFFDPKHVSKASENGQMKVIALKHANEVAAVMCIQYDNVVYRKKEYQLKSNEAYLLNMYTYQSFRGKNLAPYLRYHTYGMLRKEGIERIYSVTDYFNKSSLKFKKKLNARPIALYFAIVLFKRFHKTFKIKSYGA